MKILIYSSQFYTFEDLQQWKNNEYCHYLKSADANHIGTWMWALRFSLPVGRVPATECEIGCSFVCVNAIGVDLACARRHLVPSGRDQYAIHSHTSLHYYVGCCCYLFYSSHRAGGRSPLIARIAPGINQNSSSAQFAPGMSLKYGRAPPPSTPNCYIRRKSNFLLHQRIICIADTVYTANKENFLLVQAAWKLQ